MSSGYTRVPNDTDSDGVPEQSQIEPTTSQEQIQPSMVQPPPQNSDPMARSPSPVLATGLAYPAPPVQGPPAQGGSISYPGHPVQGPPQQGGGGESYPGHPVQGARASYPAPTFHPSVPHPVHSGQQQQSSSNVNVVMTQQPSALPSAPNPLPLPPPNPTLLIVTIVSAVVLFFFGAVPIWFCIFPAVIFAIVGYSLSDSSQEDQRGTARMMNGIAFGFDIAALVTFIIMMVIFIICIIVFTTNLPRTYYD